MPIYLLRQMKALEICMRVCFGTRYMLNLTYVPAVARYVKRSMNVEVDQALVDPTFAAVHAPAEGAGPGE